MTLNSIFQRLKALGANPFCLTNIPQTMYSFGSSNPVYGTTSNPLDNSRSPGGSSSGEAALLAYGGSILGLGTDVGGSLRTPAAFCGITSLKPTTGRIFEGGRRVVNLLVFTILCELKIKRQLVYGK